MRQYIGARYVPLIDGEWSDQKVYEPMTQVTYYRSAYISKQSVPAGITPANDEYWSLLYDFSGDYEDLNNKILTNTENITKNTNDITQLKKSNVEIRADVQLNTGNIAANTAEIAAVKSQVATNTNNIATNTAGISSNTQKNADQDTTLNSHSQQIISLNNDIVAANQKIAYNTAQIEILQQVKKPLLICDNRINLQSNDLFYVSAIPSSQANFINNGWLENGWNNLDDTIKNNVSEIIIAGGEQDCTNNNWQPGITNIRNNTGKKISYIACYDEWQTEIHRTAGNIYSVNQLSLSRYGAGRFINLHGLLHVNIYYSSGKPSTNYWEVIKLLVNEIVIEGNANYSTLYKGEHDLIMTCDNHWLNYPNIIFTSTVEGKSIQDNVDVIVKTINMLEETTIEIPCTLYHLTSMKYIAGTAQINGLGTVVVSTSEDLTNGEVYDIMLPPITLSAHLY